MHFKEVIIIILAIFLIFQFVFFITIKIIKSRYFRNISKEKTDSPKFKNTQYEVITEVEIK